VCLLGLWSAVELISLLLPWMLLPLLHAQGNRSAHRTLRAWEVDVLSKATYWEQCRRQRLVDYEDLQVTLGLHGTQHTHCWKAPWISASSTSGAVACPRNSPVQLQPKVHGISSSPNMGAGSAR